MSQFTPDQLEYLYGFPPWVVACWALAVWWGVPGTPLLLFRKRLVAGVLLVSFLSMIVTSIHNFAFANGFEVTGAMGGGLFRPDFRLRTGPLALCPRDGATGNTGPVTV